MILFYEVGYFYEYLPLQNTIYRKYWVDSIKNYGESDYKFVREFNNKNQIKFVSQYKFDANFGWLLVNGYSNYVYDDNDKLLTITQTNIDISLNKNVNKTNYFYNENNQIESKIYQIFSKYSNDWVNETKNLYNYDELGNITLEITQKWNTGWEKWIDQTKIVTTIDNDIDLENLVTSPKLNKKILKLTNFKNFSVDNPIWELQNESIYHYSQLLINSIENSNFNNLEIYPNPSKDFLHLGTHNNKSINIKIFDLNGNIVLQYNNFLEELLDIRKLTNGIYYLLIEDSEILKYVKFIKNE